MSGFSKLSGQQATWVSVSSTSHPAIGLLERVGIRVCFGFVVCGCWVPELKSSLHPLSLLLRSGTRDLEEADWSVSPEESARFCLPWLGLQESLLLVRVWKGGAAWLCVVRVLRDLTTST